MASETTKMPLKNKLQFVERLLHDVLKGTLIVCGLPKSCLPSTTCQENKYNIRNFYGLVRAGVLTRSLSKRNEWEEKFKTQQNVCEFHYDDIPKLLLDLSLSDCVSIPRSKNHLLEFFIAVCNEIILFFHHEGVDMDVNKLIKTFTLYIVKDVDIKQETPEDLFMHFDDYFLYIGWISCFIEEFAVPYGSRNDISELFLQHFEALWKFDLRQPTCLESQLIIKRKYPKDGLILAVFADINLEPTPLTEEMFLLMLSCNIILQQIKQCGKKSIWIFECSDSNTQLEGKVSQGNLGDKSGASSSILSRGTVPKGKGIRKHAANSPGSWTCVPSSFNLWKICFFVYIFLIMYSQFY